MNYNVIIRALSEEEKIAGYIAVCSAIQRLCIHADQIKGSCTTCLLRSVGCDSLNDPEKITERAELVMLWEQENPAPVWSYKDEFFKRNPDADADVKGYPTCLRQRVFKNAHLIGKKNLSPTEEWDEPYIDANFEIALATQKDTNVPEPLQIYTKEETKETIRVTTEQEEIFKQINTKDKLKSYIKYRAYNHYNKITEEQREAAYKVIQAALTLRYHINWGHGKEMKPDEIKRTINTLDIMFPTFPEKPTEIPVSIKAEPNTPEKQYNIKDLKELNEHLLERLTQYQPEFFQGHLGSYAQFCINSIRKTIDIRFGLRLSSGTKKLSKAELNGYARAIDEILPELY